MDQLDIPTEYNWWSCCSQLGWLHPLQHHPLKDSQKYGWPWLCWTVSL